MGWLVFKVGHTKLVLLLMLIKCPHPQQMLHPAGSPYTSSIMNETYRHTYRSGCAGSKDSDF